MIAHVKTTQSTRSRRGQKAIAKPDLYEQSLQEGTDLLAEKEVEAKEFKVGDPCDISVGDRVQVVVPDGWAHQAFAPEGTTGTVIEIGTRRNSKNSASIQLDLPPGKGKRQEVMVNLDRLKLLIKEPQVEESNLLEPEESATLLFVNEGDRVRGKRASRGRSPITEGFVVSLGEELVQLDTGKVYLAGIEIIERLQDQSPLSQITALLAAHGFSSLGHSSESGHADEDLESYEDWEISADAIKGGAISIQLIHRVTCGWWGMETFDHDETEDATAWVKTIIDRVEHSRRALSGQLSLLESAPVESAELGNKLAVQPAEQPTELAPESVPKSSLDDQIDRLYLEATQSEETAVNAGKAALHLYRELGEKLEQRKAETKHGGWLTYLEEHNIQERKAQRAMSISRTWDTISKSDSVTDLTLTEALGLISIKKLPAVDQDEQEKRFKLVCTAYDSVYPGGFRENSNGVFPFIFEAPGFQKTFTSLDAALEQHLKIWQQYSRYQKSNPAPTSAPAIEEIKDYFAQVGTVKDWKRGFCVERPDIGNPFPLAFNNAKTAWSYWEQNGARLLEIAQRKPMSSQVYEDAQEAEFSELEAVSAVATVVPDVASSVPNSSNQSASITAEEIHAIATEQVTSIFEKLSLIGVDVAAIVEMADFLENSIREILEENLLK